MRLFALFAFVFACVMLGERDAQAGYTHYWRWLVVPEAQRLEPCLRDMEKIANAKRDMLADGEERTGRDAVFRFEDNRPLDAGSADAEAPDAQARSFPSIAFNGIGEESHETFVFPAPFDAPGFNFVKTQWKPYDVVVVACLIAARDYFKPDELAIGSDGEWARDWNDGALLYERILGRTAVDPIGGEVVEGMNRASSGTRAGGEGVSGTKRAVLLGILGALVIIVIVVVTTRTRPG